MKLPVALLGCEEALLKALAVPTLGSWPDEDGYAVADQPQAIAKVLIRETRDDILNARIGYLFRKEIKSGDRLKLGVASKAGGKLQFLSDYDFIIEFNWSAWRDLTAEQRVALVDHELTHCVYDGEKGKYAMRHHDVEEFGEIVRRWGLWQPDLEHFGRDVRDALAQTSLFVEADA